MINKKNVIAKIKDFSKEYDQAIIYFHKDLDGVTTALAVKSLLKEYNIETIDSCVIQYGAEQYSVKKVPAGVLGVLVDFASGNTQYAIQFDHHQEQRGNSKSYTIADSKSSNVEIVNELIKKNKFTDDEIGIIRIVDSADYHRNNFKLEDIVLFSDKRDNVYETGIYLNKLILAYRSKYIIVDGKKTNFLEYLVNNSTCSINDILKNTIYAINNFNQVLFNWDKKKWLSDKLDSIDNVIKNRDTYIGRLKTNPHLILHENKVLVSEKSSPMIETGSYERYAPFYVNPDSEYFVNTFDFGFVQISKNPFNELVGEALDLSKVSRETLFRFKHIFSKIYISLFDIKVQNESNMYKIKNKISYKMEDMIGFKFDEVLSYGFDIHYKDKNGVTVKLDRDNVEMIELLRETYDKYYKDISLSNKAYLSSLKVSLWDLITSYSGGHKFITNISAINFVDYRTELESSNSIQELLLNYKINEFDGYANMKLSYKISLCISREAINVINEKKEFILNGREVEYYNIDEVIFGSNAIVEDNKKDNL